jgi:hypothetical protein
MSGHAAGAPIDWIAECRPNQCAHGALIYVRADQNERNEIARLHRRALGHVVWTYQRPAPPLDVYPEGPAE